ncbi:MAG: copper-binding protein [Pyrinomonadaceae bacterium]|nr:copper-binding protein [Pyrinomonadaceae bacterium]
MKINIIVALLSVMCSVACQRPSPTITNNSTVAPQRGVTSATHRGVGVVEAIDPEKRTIKINHEEIKGYMEAMSMDFHAREATLLNDLKPGDRIEFTLEETAGIVVITNIKKL